MQKKTFIALLSVVLLWGIVSADDLTWSRETTEADQARCVLVSQQATGDLTLNWWDTTEILPVTSGSHVSPLCYTYPTTGEHTVALNTTGILHIVDLTGQNLTAFGGGGASELIYLGLANNPNLDLLNLDLNTPALQYLVFSDTITTIESYNAFLVKLQGLRDNSKLPNMLNFYAAPIQYGGCELANRDAGITARDSLLNGWTWRTIVDGGQSDCLISEKPTSSGGGWAGFVSKSSSSTDTSDSNASSSDSSTSADLIQSSLQSYLEAHVANPQELAKMHWVLLQLQHADLDSELKDAYLYAYIQGISTMDTIEKAALDREITRAELAKMMVVYATKVLGKVTILSDSAEYWDLWNIEGDLGAYIQLAYQLQIMGIDAEGNALENFNPHQNVTRAEFATVFSRVLYGDKYNQAGSEFYAQHFAALKAAKILKNTDPTLQELRGWVMLMLMRSNLT